MGPVIASDAAGRSLGADDDPARLVANRGEIAARVTRARTRLSKLCRWSRLLTKTAPRRAWLIAWLFWDRRHRSKLSSANMIVHAAYRV